MRAGAAERQAVGWLGEMAEAYIILWTVERCRWLQRVRDEGPIEVVFGGRIERFVSENEQKCLKAWNDYFGT